MNVSYVDVSLAERAAGSLEPAAYRAGAPMRITVTVHAGEPIRCESWEVRVRALGEGRGFELDQEACRERLFEGELAAGTHTRELTLVAPSWPATYHGDNLKVDWWLEAVVVIPWATDLTSKERFVVLPSAWSGFELELPAEEGPAELGASAQEAAANRSAARSAVGCGAAVALAGAGGLAYHFARGPSAEARDASVASLVMGLLLALAVTLAPILGRLLDRALKTKQAPIDVAVTLRREGARTDYRGAAQPDSLSCEVMTKPGTQVDWMKVRLEIAEWTEWTETVGDSRRKRTAKSSRWSRIVEAERGPQEGTWRARVPLPDSEVPLTLTDTSGDGLIWQVEVLLEHSGGKVPDRPILRRVVAKPARSPQGSSA